MAADLGERGLVLAQHTRELFLELMPPGPERDEALAFIRGLVELGLIRGWRDVVWVGTLQEGEDRHATFFAPRTLTYRQFMELGKEENQKWTSTS